MVSANGILPTIQQNLNAQIVSPNCTLVLVSGSPIAAIGSNSSRRAAAIPAFGRVARLKFVPA